jgi:hypothetical protein
MKPINVPEYPFSERDMTLPSDVLSPSQAQNANAGNAVAEVDLNYASLNEELPELVALVPAFLRQNDLSPDNMNPRADLHLLP